MLNAVFYLVKTKGCKRHIAVGTMGNLLFLKVHTGNIHDTVSGSDVFAGALAKYPSIEGVCADAGYRKTFESTVMAMGKTVIVRELIVGHFLYSGNKYQYNF